MKQKRLVNKDLLISIRGLPCAACGREETVGHHIRSKGASGNDEIENLMPLCGTHHTETHTIGLTAFAKKYVTVQVCLMEKGWKFDEFNQKYWRLFNNGWE